MGHISAANYLSSGGIHYNRGQSTDATSLPQSLVQSNSECEHFDQPKLTKELLHQFEIQTRTTTATLIEAYLLKCAQEPGEIDGLITSESSANSSRRSSSDESEDSYDQEDADGSGYDEEDVHQDPGKPSHADVDLKAQFSETH